MREELSSCAVMTDGGGSLSRRGVIKSQTADRQTDVRTDLQTAQQMEKDPFKNEDDQSAKRT